MINKIFSDELFQYQPISISVIKVHVFQLPRTTIKAFNQALLNLQQQFKPIQFQQFEIQFKIISTSRNELYEYFKIKSLLPKYKQFQFQDSFQMLPVLSNQIPLSLLYQQHQYMMSILSQWSKTTSNKMPDAYKELYKLSFDMQTQSQLKNNQVFFLFPQKNNEIKNLTIEDMILNQSIGYNQPDVIIGVGQLDLTNPQISMLENQRNFNNINNESQMPISVLDIQENSAFYLVDGDGNEFPQNKLDYAFINQTEHKGGFLLSKNLYDFVGQLQQGTLLKQYQDLLKNLQFSQYKDDMNFDIAQFKYHRTVTQFQYMDMFYPLNKYQLSNFKFQQDIFGSYQLQRSLQSQTSIFSLELKEGEKNQIFSDFPQLKKSFLKKQESQVKIPTKYQIPQNVEPCNQVIDYAKICAQLGLKQLAKRLLKDAYNYVLCPVKKVFINYLILNLQNPTDLELSYVINQIQQDSIVLLKHGLINTALQFLYQTLSLMKQQYITSQVFMSQIISQFYFIQQFSYPSFCSYKIISQFSLLLSETSYQRKIFTSIVFNQFFTNFNDYNSIQLKQFLFILQKNNLSPEQFLKQLISQTNQQEQIMLSNVGLWNFLENKKLQLLGLFSPQFDIQKVKAQIQSRQSSLLLNFEDVQKDYSIQFKPDNSYKYNYLQDFNIICSVYQVHNQTFDDVKQNCSFSFYKRNENQLFITDSTLVQENQLLNDQITYIQIKFPSQHRLCPLYSMVKINHIHLMYGKFEILNYTYEPTKLSIIIKGVLSSNESQDKIDSISLQFNKIQFIREVNYKLNIRFTYVIPKIVSIQTVNLNYFCRQFQIDIPNNFNQSSNFKCLQLEFYKKKTVEKLLIQNIILGYAIIDGQIKQIQYNTEIQNIAFIFIDPLKSTKFIYTFEQGKCEVQFIFNQSTNFVTQMKEISQIHDGKFVLYEGNGTVLNSAKRTVYKRQDNLIQTAVFKPQNDSLESVKTENNTNNFWIDEISQINIKNFTISKLENNIVQVIYPSIIQKKVINVKFTQFGCDIQELTKSGLMLQTDEHWQLIIEFELEGVDLMKEVILM